MSIAEKAALSICRQVGKRAHGFDDTIDTALLILLCKTKEQANQAATMKQAVTNCYLCDRHAFGTQVSLLYSFCRLVKMKPFLNHPWFFWLVLAMPAISMMLTLSQGGDIARLLHPSGEFSARFMIFAMMLTPLLLLCRTMNWKAGWVLWLLKRRRALGVAAFAYALLHTVFYAVDMGVLQDIVAEFWSLGIWTGWLAFVIFVPLALTSNQASVKALGKKWKVLQRLVYVAAAVTLMHWVFVHNNLGAALANFIPLVLLELFRIIHWLKNDRSTLEMQNT